MTSSALASFKITSSVEVYASSGMPCISKEFFRVYCSKRSYRSYKLEISSCCSSSCFVTATSSFSADARSLVVFFVDANDNKSDNSCVDDLKYPFCIKL